MLSQFTPEGNHPTLKTLMEFPPGVYPLGRLDADSEGLLLLTNDASVNYRLLHPRFAHARTYAVQVEGLISENALRKISGGIEIWINGKKYRAQQCRVSIIDEPALPDRAPPIRYRKNIPTSWAEIKLTEGRNRQVRKMFAAAGFPVLRLVRTAIEKITLGTMSPGDVEQLPQDAFMKLLFGK